MGGVKKSLCCIRQNYSAIDILWHYFYYELWLLFRIYHYDDQAKSLAFAQQNHQESLNNI